MKQARSFLKARILQSALAIGAFLTLFCVTTVHGAPIAPNESWVVAEVVAFSVVDSSTLNIQPQQKLFRFQLRITSVEAIAGADNVLRGYEGKTIEALARDPFGTGDLKGQKIRVRISFQGDERRGHYWILESAITPPAQGGRS